MRDIDALLELLEQRSTMPFEWGINDCVTFAAAAVVAQTGRDPLGRLQWSDEAGARKALVKVGGLEAALDARFPRTSPAAAMRGDLAAAPDPLGIRVMVVEGATLVGPGERGLERVPRAEMVAAWSVDTPAAPAAQPVRLATRTQPRKTVDG